MPAVPCGGCSAYAGSTGRSAPGTGKDGAFARAAAALDVAGVELEYSSGSLERGPDVVAAAVAIVDVAGVVSRPCRFCRDRSRSFSIECAGAAIVIVAIDVSCAATGLAPSHAGDVGGQRQRRVERPHP